MSKAALGSYEWGERTHGILSRADRLRLTTGLARAQLAELLSRMSTHLGLQSSRRRRLDLDRVTIPDSATARAAEVLTHHHYSEPLRLHCLRTYYFASLWSQFYGVRTDSEVLYVASLLHDLGLAAEFREASGCCGFAIVGARRASRFAAAQGWQDTRRRAVYEAISYHLNPYLSLASHEPEAVCLQRAAHLDVVGAGRHLLPTDIITAVHRTCPRTGFRDEILDTMLTMRHPPESRAAVLRRLGFAGIAAQNPLDRLAGQRDGAGERVKR